MTDDMHFNYSNATINQLWDDMAAGFYNSGMIAPERDVNQILDLKQANEDMTDFIIEKLQIKEVIVNFHRSVFNFLTFYSNFHVHFLTLPRLSFVN